MPKSEQLISKSEVIVPVDLIQRKIFVVRGRKIMLDRDLAVLYGVENPQTQ